MHKNKNTQHNHKIIFTPSVLIGFTITQGIILGSSFVSADDVVDDITITVPVSCTMTGTGMDSHTANITNGTYQADIGTTTLKAFCNDNEGFSIYAAGYTGEEVGGENSTKLVGTPTAIGNIDTGTAENGNTSNWAMKLATNASATYALELDNGYDNYSVVPAEYTKVAHRDSATDIPSSNTTATGAELTTTYAAYISPTQTAGTYAGKVIYVLVHPASAAPPPQPIQCPAGYVCYAPNAYDAVGTMNVPDVGTSPDGATNTVGYQKVSSGTEVTLIAPNFKRAGYGFAGWNTKYDDTGENFGPNQTILVGDLTERGMSLYAKWIPSSGELQGFNSCDSLIVGEVIGLTDSRDGNVYAVTKHADGQCWMMENLRLSGESEVALTVENSNSPATGFINLPNTSDSWCEGYDDELCINQSKINTNNTNMNGVNASGTELISANGGPPGAILPQGYSGNNLEWFNYGNYYNWYAATAGNGVYSLEAGEAIGDICPAGWSLPTGGANGQFATLDLAMGGTGAPQGTFESTNKWRSYPYNFVYSGTWSGSYANQRGYYGGYWSRTAYDAQNTYYFYIYPGGVNPGIGNDAKYSGYTIRCIVNN